MSDSQNSAEPVKDVSRDPGTDKGDRQRKAASDGIAGLSFLIFAGIIAFFIYYVYEYTGFSSANTSVYLYMTYGANVTAGLIPYHDFFIEYPPLSLVFFTVPAFFVNNFTGTYQTDYIPYANAYTALVYIFCLAGTAVAGLCGRKYGRSPILLMFVFTACLCAIGPIVPKWYDIFATIPVIAAVYTYFSEHRNIAWFLLALATLTKLYPILLAPVFLIPYLVDMMPHLSESRRVRTGKNKVRKSAGDIAADKQAFTDSLKKAVIGFSIFVLTGLAVCLPLMICDYSGFMSFLEYHSDRGVQIESLLASFVFLGHDYGVEAFAKLPLALDYGSVNIHNDTVSSLGKCLTPLMIIVLALIYGLFLREVIRRSEKGGRFITSSEFIRNPENARLFAMTCFLAITAFIIVGKIFSPQYIIWLFPFVSLAFLSGNAVGKSAGITKESILAFLLFALFIVIALMTFYIFPTHYTDLYIYESTIIHILFIRNICVIAAGIIAALLCRRYCSDDADPSPEKK